MRIELDQKMFVKYGMFVSVSDFSCIITELPHKYAIIYIFAALLLYTVKHQSSVHKLSRTKKCSLQVNIRFLSQRRLLQQLISFTQGLSFEITQP